MILAYTAAAIRRAEQPLLARGAPLMASAAFSIAVRARAELQAARAWSGARILVLVGPGNNGGDGLFAAMHLARWGARVQVLCVASRAHDDGLRAARAAGVRIATFEPAAEPASAAVDELAVATSVSGDRFDVAGVIAQALAADLVLDAILGVGATGALRPAQGTVVDSLSRALDGQGSKRALVIAVDVPSGIGVDDGSLPGPVLRADVTLACGARAAGVLLAPAAVMCGRVELIDLGIPADEDVAVRRLEDTDAARLVRVPGPGDDKYSRGVVGVVAGTPAYPGAAVLAVSAAAHCGAGMVRYLGPDGVTEPVLARTPEAVPSDGRVQSWVLGPGVDPEDDEQSRRIASVLGEAQSGRIPVVVDAGALHAVAGQYPHWVVLTPHAGELATLLTRLEPGAPTSRAQVEAAPLAHARRAHTLTGATVLLKGSTTLVVGAGGTLTAAQAPAWLATAGAGDVLAGLLGTLLAARSDEVIDCAETAVDLAGLAAHIHGQAGHAANPDGPVTASQLTAVLGPVIAALLASSAVA